MKTDKPKKQKKQEENGPSSIELYATKHIFDAEFSLKVKEQLKIRG